ncbi:hypothetical protein COLO4_11483 [Corchorus olitorius]|uniref:Uncharacterized protein n=1 Tax=Corchorus olitorius TaxID=93759 RepID=A0A1R3K4B6_9ROSI|nr:hypothetical protein COLO4_11483 [Corchorus olitorius]
MTLNLTTGQMTGNIGLHHIDKALKFVDAVALCKGKAKKGKKDGFRCKEKRMDDRQVAVK